MIYKQKWKIGKEGGLFKKKKRTIKEHVWFEKRKGKTTNEQKKKKNKKQNKKWMIKRKKYAPKMSCLSTPVIHNTLFSFHQKTRKRVFPPTFFFIKKNSLRAIACRD